MFSLATGETRSISFAFALQSQRVVVRQAFRRQRLRIQRDLARRLVADPDLLNAAADFVVVHRRGLAGHGQRERGHDRARAEDDADAAAASCGRSGP